MNKLLKLMISGMGLWALLASSDCTATDATHLERDFANPPDAVARTEHSVNGHLSVLPSRPGIQQWIERLTTALLGRGSSPTGGDFVRLEPFEGRTFAYGSEEGGRRQLLSPARQKQIAISSPDTQES